MLASMREFAAAYSVFLWMVLATVVVIVLLAQRRVRLWVSDFWVAFPGIGTIARSSDITERADGFRGSEANICAIYKNYVAEKGQETFIERIEYLKHAGDTGRSPTPFFVWLLLAVLVVAEGLGFSYMLGTWMAREGSADTHSLLMVAIVFVLCVLLVALTHFAGHQAFRTSLLRACHKIRTESNKKGDFKNTVLNDNQFYDQDEPYYQRTINRVADNQDSRGSYGGLWLTLIFGTVIVVASTWMRTSALEAELSRETIMQHQSAAENDPFLKLPTEVTAPQKDADEKAHKEIQSSTRNEGMAAFIMLGFIFAVTQIVGMGVGYKYGFAGKESKAAYNEIGGFSTYEAYLSYSEPIRDLANRRLKALQTKLESQANSNLNLNKTFDDYLASSVADAKKQAEEKARSVKKLRESAALAKEQDKQDEKRKAEKEAPRNDSPATTPAPTVNVALAAVQPAPPHQAAPVPLQSTSKPTTPAGNADALSLEAIKAEIEKLGDAQAEKAYYGKLPESAKTADLRNWLKDRKVAREAAKAKEEEDLF